MARYLARFPYQRDRSTLITEREPGRSSPWLNSEVRQHVATKTLPDICTVAALEFGRYRSRMATNALSSPHCYATRLLHRGFGFQRRFGQVTEMRFGCSPYAACESQSVTSRPVAAACGSRLDQTEGNWSLALLSRTQSHFYPYSQTGGWSDRGTAAALQGAR